MKIFKNFIGFILSTLLVFGTKEEVVNTGRKIYRTIGVLDNGIAIDVDIIDNIAYKKNTDERVPIGTTVSTLDGIWKRCVENSIRVDNHNFCGYFG